MRLQSQQMLDQIHDEPLQASDTGPVDGDNDSSESEENPKQNPKRVMRKPRLRVQSRFGALNNVHTVANGRS